jgi:hypothetical protein
MPDAPAAPLSRPLSRRAFVAKLGVLSGALAVGGAVGGAVARPALAEGVARELRGRRYEFVFARLRYSSGDWDYNPKVCSNMLDAVVQYTDIPVNQQEVVITADSADLTAFPFLFMTGHKLVRFSEKERQGLVRYVENGGLLFSDDCNHDVNGLYAKTFEAEMQKAFGPNAMPKLPKQHPLYQSFFAFPEGPPRTSHELNGWGDNVVHDYLRGVERRGRLGVLYSNKDYGCEWDYDWKNKRFRSKDNTKFGVNIAVYAMT